MPPSASAVARYCYRHCCRPPLLLTPPLAATTAASSRCRRQSLPPPPSTAASIDRCCRRHQPLLLPPPASPNAACHCLRPLPLPLPPSTATAATAGHCRRRRQMLPLLTAATAAPAVGRSLRHPPWSTQGPLWPPWLVVEALGTRSIPSELSAILAAHSSTVREDGTARTPEEHSVWVIHSFLAQLVSGEDLVPGLDWVIMVGLDPDKRVLILHSLFYVQVNFYSTHRCLFACMGEIPAKGLPPVVDITNQAFAVQLSVRAVLQVYHVT